MGVRIMKTEAQKPTQLEPKNKPIKEPWNKGKLMGQKPPLKLKEVWEIRIRLQLGKYLRELALFNLAIDSKLRGCDLVKLKVRDVAHGDNISKRAMICKTACKTFQGPGEKSVEKFPPQVV
jgi:hypothetical protein